MTRSAIIVALALAVAPAAMASSQVKQTRLESVASGYAGRTVTIVGTEDSQGVGSANWDTGQIRLWSAGLATLVRLPRLDSGTGQAFFSYAHELGHLVTIAADPSLKGTPNQTGGLDVSRQLSIQREQVASDWACQNAVGIGGRLGLSHRLSVKVARSAVAYSRSLGSPGYVCG